MQPARRDDSPGGRRPPDRPTLDTPDSMTRVAVRGTATRSKEECVKPGYLLSAGCVLSVVGLLGIIVDDTGGKKPAANPLTVTVTSLSFDPRKLEVDVGDTVMWSNQARTKHTATSDDDGKTFDTGEIAPGQSSK